jgi:uroporphyrin-III C-methyltransferase
LGSKGIVYLVGAGPGDPELLTLKARRLLDEADVVVYDRLVSDDILALIPVGTAKISVGKQPRSHPVPQPEINALLARLASTGRTVVRLKGGDPFMFGRGSEEAAYLIEQGIAFSVVPGVTSASGCAAAVGLPLTHRGLATGVRFITGHCREDLELDLDWRGLADPNTTLVIYMGRTNVS